MEFRFTGPEQACAVYDVVQHRVLTVSKDVSELPYLEQEETFELVSFLHRLEPLIRDERAE